MGLNDIDKTLQTIDIRTTINQYDNPQLNFEGNAQEMRYFVRRCVDYAEYYHVDILTGFQRERIGMILSDVLDHVTDESMVGIKVVAHPIFDIHEHDRWEGGYIEGCLRTMTTTDYFVWTYIKMDRLKLILADYKDKLTLL